MTVKWEYHVQAISLSATGGRHVLDQLGQAGWELVSVVFVAARLGTSQEPQSLCYLKRPVE